MRLNLVTIDVREHFGMNLGVPRCTKNVWNSIVLFTDRENVSKVSLALNDEGKTFWGEFGSRQMRKIVYMVCGQLINTSITPDFDMYIIYDLWEKGKPQEVENVPNDFKTKL
jgi:hypothetical protein